MGLLALIFLAAYVTVTLGLRALIQYRLTGSTGIHGVGGKPWSAEGTAAALIVLAALGAFAAPVLDFIGIVAPIAGLDAIGVRAVGFVLYALGFTLTFIAQMTMGRSWRVGVAHGEVTELVVRGVFRFVRNPIFAAMMVTSAGVTLLIPNVVAVGSFIALVAALEFQVRFVEEPHLLRVHGAAYAHYAAAVGRFVPYLGKLRRPSK